MDSPKTNPSKGGRAMLESSTFPPVPADLVNLVAHDLGHLTSSLSMAVDDMHQILSKTPDLTLSETYQRRMLSCVSDARQSCDRMLETVRALRSMGSRRDKIEVIDLLELVQNVMTTMSSSIARNQIKCEIEINSGIICLGRRDALFNVFINLLLNSIEASNYQSRKRSKNIIHIVANVSNRMIQCDFWDEGPGIDPVLVQQKERIFDPGVTSNIRKAGLGLTIVRSLLRNEFSGDIELVDPLCARFRLHIPFYEKKSPAD